MKIIIGSKNPAKITAVKNAFPGEFEMISLDIPSGVNDQPFSDEETIKGAVNRATKALEEGSGDIELVLKAACRRQAKVYLFVTGGL
jgi:non-canonical (house-cleaning) NTP pyrophosphatase